MIKAVFYRKNGSFSGFEISGHAGYGRRGRDICCAAVSSAGELVCNTVTDFFHDASAKARAGDNSLVLTTDGRDKRTEAVIYSFFTHMGFIAEEFPEGVSISVSDSPN